MPSQPTLALLLALLLAGCSTATRTVILQSGPTSVEALLATYQPEVGRNITRILLAQTERTSEHLVFVRDREDPHDHATQDLIVTILRGRGTLWLGARETPMHEGDIAVVPAGVRHWFVNQGEEPAVAFIVFAPRSPESVPKP